MTEDVGWLGVVGGVFSALSTTVNGIASLWGIADHWLVAHDPAVHDVVGGLLSGTVAVTGGWLTAAKLSGTQLGATTVGLSAGCVYATLGFVYLLYTMSRTNFQKPPMHAPARESADAMHYPQPNWLNTRVINWGVMGRVAVGKSTLINSVRGLRPRCDGAAPVGIGHTTRRPHPYSFVTDSIANKQNMARLWDLPGAGSREWPVKTYVNDAGLRHFDGILFVTASAFSDVEAELIRLLKEFDVPYYLVRNKVDQDIVNNEDDNGVLVDETLAEIRRELYESGCAASRTFLISAKDPEHEHLEFGHLLRGMATDVLVQRGEQPEFGDRERIAPRPHVGPPRSGAPLRRSSSTSNMSMPMSSHAVVPPRTSFAPVVTSPARCPEVENNFVARASSLVAEPLLPVPQRSTAPGANGFVSLAAAGAGHSIYDSSSDVSRATRSHSVPSRRRSAPPSTPCLPLSDLMPRPCFRRK